MDSTLARRAEMLGGQRFVWTERTPRLHGMIDGAQNALVAALERIGCAARVLREPDVLLSAQTAVIPDLAIFTGPTWNVPALLIEYRAESTDRLFFGPKRLAYARARVPEVWFADAGTTRVTTLRLHEGLEYPWPAPAVGAGETVWSSSIAGLTLLVDDLFWEREQRHGHA